MLKFFIYIEGRYYSEASMLMQSIMTIMKMTKEERNRVQEARDNSSLWNTTKSYISSTIFPQNFKKDVDYYRGNFQIN